MNGRFALCLVLLGCGPGSTANLPADLEARVAQEGVVRRAADQIFRYTIHRNAKIGLEISPRTRREVAVERDGRRVRVRAGSGRSVTRQASE